MYLNLNLILLLVLINDSATIGRLAPDELTFLILSQENEYHRNVAEHLKQHIVKQVVRLQEQEVINTNRSIHVHLSHETFMKKRGAWAIVPVMEEIHRELIRKTTKWLVVLEPNCRVNLGQLLYSLSKEDHRKAQYLGHAIYDIEPTIIHHFSFFENPSQFKYPLMKAGIALTVPLLNGLVQRLPNTTLSSDFFIDASHELALFIWNKNNGVRLKPVPWLCARKRKNCAIYGIEFPSCTKEKPPVDVRRILFAVKTCKKFHKERMTVIMNTWGQLVPHLRIYSDVEDPKIPTISTSVPNTETGHCEKTIKILNLIEAELNGNHSIEWIVLADDDTIMGIMRLAQHLACYRTTADLYLGERYGYQLLDEFQGYNYVTGGGGLVLSRSTLTKLARNCRCPAPASPDDMILASCLSQFRIVATHSPLFHQARPLDYPTTTIDANVISFHKYWQIDPYSVYRQFFKQDDDNFFDRIKYNQPNDGNDVDGDNSGDDANDDEGNRDAPYFSDGCKHASCNEIIRRSDYEMNHTDL